MKFSFNVAQLRLALAQRNQTFLADVRDFWARAVGYFIGFIQKTQMTGRPGLRVITGLLRNSWHSSTLVQGHDVVTRVYTGVRYARVHEYGSPSKEIPQIIIPARQQVLAFQVRRSKPGKPGGNRFAKHRFDKQTGALLNKRTKSVRVGAHTITMPQRLHVREAWKTVGLGLLASGINDALKKFGKGGP